MFNILRSNCDSLHPEARCALDARLLATGAQSKRPHIKSIQIPIDKTKPRQFLRKRICRSNHMTPTDRNAPCPCGSTKKYKHCCKRADEKHLLQMRSSDRLISNWYEQGMKFLQQGQTQLAKQLFEQVLHANPSHAEATQWLGVVYFQQGNGPRALELVTKAVTLDSHNPTIHATLGNVQQALGQVEAAISSYQKAISIKPDFTEAYNNLGNSLASHGKLQDAIESYKKAVDLQPAYAEARNNLGTVFQALGMINEATSAYEQALSLRPNYPQALCNIASVLQEQKPDDAEQYARQALKLQPNYYEAWVTLGKILLPQGKIDQARLAIGHALSVHYTNGLAVFQALMLPTIMGTLNEVIESRKRFEMSLEQLITQRITLKDPVKELCGTNFQLAYQALNDRDIQRRVAYFYAQACPQLTYSAPHCSAPRHAMQNKKKIGFFSRFIAKHSVALSYSKIIEKLSNDHECDVVLISPHDPDKTSVQQEYPNFRGTYVRIVLDLAKAREQIAKLNLDILVYLDVGMDPFGYFLAYSRLAHTQCVFDGHPVTTGLPAMDYFLSVDLAEPENAQDHYSEKLQRFPFGAFCFEKADTPKHYKTRGEIGMPEAGNIYLCPMVLFKIHPDFDEAIERILRSDLDGKIIFFEDKKYSNWHQQLQDRFDKTISKTVRDRIIFMPWITDRMDFMSAIQQSNVILDPFHFGLGTTAIATCTVGTPFVTKPGEFARGRYGQYYCRLLGIMECVASDTLDYVQKAVAIATDSKMRSQIKSKILTNNHMIFDNYQGVQEVRDFFMRL